MKRSDDVVTASEIASWAWCPESWRLDSLDAEPGNRAEMARGETHHVQKAAFEERSRSAISVGWCLLAFSALVGLEALLALTSGCRDTRFSQASSGRYGPSSLNVLYIPFREATSGLLPKGLAYDFVRFLRGPQLHRDSPG